MTCRCIQKTAEASSLAAAVPLSQILRIGVLPIIKQRQPFPLICFCRVPAALAELEDTVFV